MLVVSSLADRHRPGLEGIGENDRLTNLAFGMQLPIQAQSTLFAQPWERDAGPTELTEIIRACDEAGLDYVGVCDHVTIPRDDAARMTTTWYDPVATLGWAGALTRRVRLLSHIYVLPYRHPRQTAKSFATLDALSTGRVILGVGAGHLRGEFDLLGVPYAQRGRRTDEAIATVRALFADEWGAGDGGLGPRPVQPAGPPIWVGGSSRAAISRAARLGEGWLPQGPPPGGMADAVHELQRQREKAGRADEPFAIGGGVGLYVGNPPDRLPPGCVAGSVQQIAAHLRDQAELGVTHLQLRFPVGGASELIDQIHAFAAEIAPLTLR